MRKLLLSIGLLFGLLGPAPAVINQTLVGNVAYTVLSTDLNLVTTTAFTAARTWTLPYAAASCIPQCGGALQILDAGAVITSTNTLTIAPQSGETINGNAANLILNTPGLRVILLPTSGSNWQAIVEGDYVATSVLTGAAVSLTSTTAANIVTQSLSQGEWECRGLISRNLNASTSVTLMAGSIGTITATIATQGTNATTSISTAANVIGATGADTQVGPVRISLTATTNVFLVARDTFSVSTNAAYGELACRRIR